MCSRYKVYRSDCIKTLKACHPLSCQARFYEVFSHWGQKKSVEYFLEHRLKMCFSPLSLSFFFSTFLTISHLFHISFIISVKLLITAQRFSCLDLRTDHSGTQPLNIPWCSPFSFFFNPDYLQQRGKKKGFYWGCFSVCDKMASCQNGVRIISPSSHLFSELRTSAWLGNVLWNEDKVRLVRTLGDSPPLCVRNEGLADFHFFYSF